MMDVISWLAAVLGGAAAGVAVGALIVGPYLNKHRWYEMDAEELSAQIAKHGLQYDFTVASTQALVDHVNTDLVRERFMDRLVERLKTQPVTNMQYTLLADVACSVDRDYWARLKKRGWKGRST